METKDDDLIKMSKDKLYALIKQCKFATLFIGDVDDQDIIEKQRINNMITILNSILSHNGLERLEAKIDTFIRKKRLVESLKNEQKNNK